jgi:hypothetical protein
MGRRILVAAVLAALTLTGAACGDGDDNTDVASLDAGDHGAADDTGDRGGDGPDQPTDEEVEEAMLEFSQCMREHGIDMPDPDTSGGGGAVMIGPGSEDGAPDMDEFEAADEACRHLIEDVMGTPQGMSPEEQAEMQDRMLEHTQCMREHGVDLPDPVFGDGGMITQELAGEVDPTADEFAQAQEACGDLLGGGEVIVGSSGAAGSGPNGDDQ